jgi:DNA-directed RNA polymerase specialized sigma24 family protein
VMRECLHELDSEDQAMASQLQAITERQWRIASEALGVSESTLRSRWKRTLDRLRSCIARKTGKNLAPDGDESDR